MKYAIIADSIYKDGEWKNFYILLSDLSTEQVNNIIKSYNAYIISEERKTVHPLDTKIKIEGFDYEFSGDFLTELSFGKIIPMWNFENFN